MVFLIASFAVGLVVGSFLNVVILRSAAPDLRGGLRQSWLARMGGRSRCDGCGKTLSARELIPVASFVVQKARCRSCGAALSWQYPLVELGTAASFSVAAGALMPYADLPTFFIMLGAADAALAALMVVIVADFRFQIIPDGAVAVLGIAGGGASVMRGSFASDGAAALALALFFASLWFFSRGRWMGFGDAKLAFATSLAVGFPASLAAFLFSFWAASVAAAPLLILGKKSMGSRIPFGPFLIAGSGLAWMWGGAFFSATGLSVFF